MPRLRLYDASTVMVPRPWLDAMGAPGHLRQADVLAVGRTKPDVAGMLFDFGAPHWMAGELRLTRMYSTPVEKLVDAGVVSLFDPGLYAWRDMTDGSTVVSVSRAGAEPVARWALVSEPRTIGGTTGWPSHPLMTVKRLP